MPWPQTSSSVATFKSKCCRRSKNRRCRFRTCWSTRALAAHGRHTDPSQCSNSARIPAASSGAQPLFIPSRLVVSLVCVLVARVLRRQAEFRRMKRRGAHHVVFKAGWSLRWLRPWRQGNPQPAHAVCAWSQLAQRMLGEIVLPHAGASRQGADRLLKTCPDRHQIVGERECAPTDHLWRLALVRRED
jgi:hypothetical protein